MPEPFLVFEDFAAMSIGASLPPTSAHLSAGSRPRVLVVEDDETLARSYARLLRAEGYEVETRFDGVTAVDAVDAQSFDVVLSDIDMPRLTGLGLLEHIRAHDLDIPVVLITASPSMETALPAIAHGALRYLAKPVDTRELRAITATAVRMHRLARAKRKAIDLAGRFALRLVYQPIISWSRREVFGFEALLRSNEPSLENACAILDAAERLCCLPELGQRIRATACAAAPGLPGGSALFINLHTHDLLDDELFDPTRPLARMATRVVLEISDRANLHHMRDLHARIARLRAMGFRIAVDDLDAGYAGLTSFAQLQPEVVKLDVSLVRDVHAQPTKLALVRTMIATCTELGIQVVAEGIETPEERDAIVAAGCDLMQGFLFAKPGEAFPVAVF